MGVLLSRRLSWLAAWLCFAAFVGVAYAVVHISRDLVFQWAPSSGPVVAYEVGITEAPNPERFERVQEERIVLRPTAHTVLSIRVRGLDDSGTSGPWSEISEALLVRPLPGDSTQDGMVGAPDFYLLSENYGKQGWDIEPVSPMP